MFGVAGGILLAGLIGSATSLWFATALIKTKSEVIKVQTETISAAMRGIMLEMRSMPSLITPQPIYRQVPVITEEMKKAAYLSQIFKVQYKQPRECEKIKDWDDQIKCSNHYMIAQKKFNAAAENNH